ncbi:MAG: hydroxymethylglutaryl-CoA reductase [Candidatus Saccharimonadaceae bacterium]
MKIVRGFSKLSRVEKIRFIEDNLPIVADLEKVTNHYRHETDQSVFDNFSENTLSNFYLPYGVAPNFLIDGKMYVLPMVIEESSVVAAASRAAAFWANHGGFKTIVQDSVKIGHLWFKWNGDASILQSHNSALQAYLIASVKDITQSMERRGGGITNIQFIQQPELQDVWQMQVSFNTADSMGANFINTCLEAMKEPITNYFEERDLPTVEIIMAILSNYTPDCLVNCEVSCKVDQLSYYAADLSPHEFATRFQLAMDIAYHNTERAVTHNKGIYNGIDAVVLATGNDFRAVEAAGHAFASRDGKYRSLSTCQITKEGEFKLSLTLPLALGTVGGLTRLHPLATLSMEILQNPTAEELMSIAASAGLANNFSAVASLVTTGIQKGHMKMHLSNILTSFNATPEEKERTEFYFSDKTVSIQKVREFLKR